MKSGYEQYFYSLFDENEKFSLSELDINGESFRILGGGVKLAFLHEKGYLHKDLHIAHFLISPKNVGEVGIIDVAFEKAEVEPENMFIDFVPPFMSLNKSQFIAFLVGYYKAGIFSLDIQRKNFTTDLLLLLGGKTQSLISPNLEIEKQYQNYLSLIDVPSYSNNIKITAQVFDAMQLRVGDKFCFKLFLACLNLSNSIDAFSQKELEFGFPNLKEIDNDKAWMLIEKFNELVNNFTNKEDTGSTNFTLIKNLILETKRNTLELEISIWKNVILLFDMLSKKIDDFVIENKLVKELNSKLIYKSVAFAQTSLIILQQLTPNSRVFESLELSIKTRHFALSWYSSPTKNWFTSPETPKLKPIKLSDPISSLEKELKKYEDSRAKLIVIEPDTLLYEFQYINSLITTLNHLFICSIEEYKSKKVSNLLWSCSYRAISYSKRNSYVFLNHFLSNNKSALILQGLQYSLMSYGKSIHLYIQASMEFLSPIILLKGATSYYEHYDILTNDLNLIKEVIDILKNGDFEVKSKEHQDLFIKLKASFPIDIDSYFSQ